MSGWGCWPIGMVPRFAVVWGDYLCETMSVSAISRCVLENRLVWAMIGCVYDAVIMAVNAYTDSKEMRSFLMVPL